MTMTGGTRRAAIAATMPAGSRVSCRARERVRSSTDRCRAWTAHQHAEQRGLANAGTAGDDAYPDLVLAVEPRRQQAHLAAAAAEAALQDAAAVERALTAAALGEVPRVQRLVEVLEERVEGPVDAGPGPGARFAHVVRVGEERQLGGFGGDVDDAAGDLLRQRVLLVGEAAHLTAYLPRDGGQRDVGQDRVDLDAPPGEVPQDVDDGLAESPVEGGPVGTAGGDHPGPVVAAGDRHLPAEAGGRARVAEIEQEQGHRRAGDVDDLPQPVADLGRLVPVAVDSDGVEGTGLGDVSVGQHVDHEDTVRPHLADGPPDAVGQCRAGQRRPVRRGVGVSEFGESAGHGGRPVPGEGERPPSG
jgi:hypothetical protein